MTYKHNIALVAILGLVQVTSAQVNLLVENFDSDTGDFYLGGDGNTGDIQHTSFGGGQLEWSRGSAQGGDATVGASFTETTLAIGDKLYVEADMTQFGTIARIGVGDLTLGSPTTISANDWNAGSDHVGYTQLFRDNSGAAQDLRYDPSSAASFFLNGGAAANDIAVLNSTVDLDQPGTIYTLTMELTRTSATELSIVATVLDGVTEIYSNSGIATDGDSNSIFTFDMVAFRTNDGSALGDGSTTLGSTSLDNVLVQYTAVPEPSTFALLAGSLALASVMVRRRIK